MTYQIQTSSLAPNDSSLLLVCLRDPSTDLEYDVVVDFDLSVAQVTAWYDESGRRQPITYVDQKDKLAAEMWASRLDDVWLRLLGAE